MDKSAVNNGRPKLSVLMCVFNGEKYLSEAVESILSQTFASFEFIIINDGSTDGTLNILSSFKDSRLKIINNRRNEGLIASLNTGLSVAQGEFVARMDADDISLPGRFEKQVHFLEVHPEIGLCGTWLSIIGGDNNCEFPVLHDEIKAAMLNNNPVAHPTVMFRSELFADQQLVYDSNFPGAEDYELWTRMVFKTRMANIAEPLVQYRKHAGQVTETIKEIVNDSTQKVKFNFLKQFKIFPDARESHIHLFLFNYEPRMSGTDSMLIKEVDKWLYKLFMANQQLGILDENIFCRIWRTKLFTTAIKKFDFATWKIMWPSYCFKYGKVTLNQKVRLFIKCLIRRHVGLFLL